MDKYTPEQVERAAEHLRVQCFDELEVERMLTAYAATLRQQAARVDEGIVEALEMPEGYELAELIPGVWHYEWDHADDDGERMASGTSWNHPALAAIGAWQDHTAALAQNTQGEAAVEIVEWRENASPRLRFFTKVSNLPAGTKLYLHAERARVPELMMEQLADAAAALDKLGRRDQCRHLMALHEMLSAPSQPEDAE